MMHVSATVRVMPWPPARVDSRKMKLFSEVPGKEVGTGHCIHHGLRGAGSESRVMPWPPVEGVHRRKMKLSSGVPGRERGRPAVDKPGSG